MIRYLPLVLLLTGLTEAAAQVGVPTATTPPAADFGSSLFQLLFGLAAVIALLIGSLWLLKKLSAPRGEAAGLMRVVAGTAVGPRERVVIVEVGSTWLVLGVAPGRVSTLAEVPRQSISAPPNTESVDQQGNFADWLRKLTHKK